MAAEGRGGAGADLGWLMGAGADQQGRWSWALAVAGIALSLLVAAGAGGLIIVEKDRLIEAEKANVVARARVLSEHVRQMLSAASVVLDSVEDDVRRSGARSADDLRQAMSSRAVFDHLVERARTVPQVDVATIVADNGDVINFTRSHPAPPINLSDRDYFKAHMGQDASALPTVISAPVRNRGTGTWTFYLSRALRNAEGRVIGLVLTGINIAYIEHALTAIRPNDDFEPVAVSRGRGPSGARAADRGGDRPLVRQRQRLSPIAGEPARGGRPGEWTETGRSKRRQ